MFPPAIPHVTVSLILTRTGRIKQYKLRQNRAKPFGSALFLRIYHIQKNFSFSKRAD